MYSLGLIRRVAIAACSGFALLAAVAHTPNLPASFDRLRKAGLPEE